MIGESKRSLSKKGVVIISLKLLKLFLLVHHNPHTRPDISNPRSDHRESYSNVRRRIGALHFFSSSHCWQGQAGQLVLGLWALQPLRIGDQHMDGCDVWDSWWGEPSGEAEFE